MNRLSTLSLGLALCGAALAAPGAAQAVVVYSNFGAGLTYDTAQGGPVGNAFDGGNYALGSSFTAATAFVFDSLLIALSCVANCPAADAFTVTLATNIAGAPGAAIESFVVPGAVLGAFGAVHAPLTLNSVLHPGLSADTLYWVTVKADLVDSVAWNLNITSDAHDTAISSDGGATWFAPSGLTAGAYAISSAVPEPASWASLFGGGCLLLAWRRRSSRLRD